MGDTTATSAQIAAISAKIMIATILVVFFLMLFLFCLHIYAKCYWSGYYEDPAIVSWRRREARRRGRPAAVAAQRRGLDPLALRSIPIIVFNPKDFKDGLECAVCLSELSQGEKARILPKCDHGFHADCIDMWFHSHSTCPLCRNPVVPPPQNPSSTKPNHRTNNGVETGSSNTSSSDSDSDDDESYASVPSTEPPTFPTNALLWGNQTQASFLEGVGAPSIEGISSTSAGSASCSTSAFRPRDELVIGIPRELFEDCVSSPLPPCGGDEEEVKSPVMKSLRSLKRLLSRGKRVASSPRGSSSGDHVEQV